jgi:hypothetical protein
MPAEPLALPPLPDSPPCARFGCTNPDAINYEPTVKLPCTDCSSHVCECCIVVGCMDSTASTYNAAATKHLPSQCVWKGCNISHAENYNPRAVEGDGSCVVKGCMAPTATNYDPAATEPCVQEGTQLGGAGPVRSFLPSRRGRPAAASFRRAPRTTATRSSEPGEFCG